MIDFKAISRKTTFYPAWRSYIFSWILIFIILVLSIVFIIYSIIDFLFLFIPLLIIFFIVFLMVFRRMHYKYEIKHHFVKSELGIFTRREQELHISDVRMVSVDQSFFDRILNIGDVHIASAATDDVEILLKSINNPLKLKQTINLLKHYYNTRKYNYKKR